MGAADCRRRATPPHPKDTGEWMQNVWKRGIGRHRRHWHRKWSKKHARTIKISPKWLPKSIPNRWKIKAASQMRFWSVFGGPWGPRDDFGILLGTIFAYKSEKMRQGSRKGSQSRKKRHLKIDVKNCIEKWRKSMPKGFQNDAKMETQICDCSCFLEEGESWEKTVGFSNRKPGSDHVERFQDWLRIYAKSVLKWDMEKEHRKDVKMVPKWEPKSHTKWEMEWKRHAKK